MAGKNKDTFCWSPQPGPQLHAIQTRRICDELLFGGARGGGKTIFLLMDYASDVKEYKGNWNGVIFRRTYPQLEDIIQKSQSIFPKVFNTDLDKIWRAGEYAYRFPNGATLKLRHLDNDSDAENYQGHEYQWIGYDELTHWPTDGPYKKLFATLRSSVPGVFKRIRATANPGSAGNSWVKRRFVDMDKNGMTLFRDESTGMTRMFIRSLVSDNRILLQNDPGYVGRLKAACRGNPQLLRAWLHGDWDVFFGQFFSMFDPGVHKADPERVLPNGFVPAHWRIEGSLDYGESKPTSFGLWATNEYGESYRISEYYQSGLWLSEHVAGIYTLCKHNPYTKGRMPERIWADPQIFYTRASAGSATMSRMVSDVFYHNSNRELKLVKSNRDRVSGWRFLKNLMAWKRGHDGEFTLKPKIYYFPECTDFERQFSDATYAGTEDSPSEDLDTDCEDHGIDDARYFSMGSRKGTAIQQKRQESGLSANYVFGRTKRAAKGMALRREAPMLQYRQLFPRNEELEETLVT